MLYTLIELGGWECRQKPIERGILEPYMLEKAKVFFVKCNALSISHFYTWALAAASEHKKEVAHFQGDKYYKAIIMGTEYRPDAIMRSSKIRYS